MKLEEFYQHLVTLELPVQYYSYQEGQAPSLPYLIYYQPEKVVLHADNITYCTNNTVKVEVYTDFKDPTLEARIEKLFNTLKITYTFQETYIREERMYMIVYELTI